MAFVNLDGTLVLENSALLVAELNGKGEEAKGILHDVLKRSPEVIEMSETPQALIKNLDALYEPALVKGAELVKGFPESRLSEVRFKLNPKLPKIREIAEENGGFEIGTMSARDFVNEFVRQHAEKLPREYSVACASDLEKFAGYFTGRISSYCGVEAKMNSRKSKVVFANGLPDFGASYKAEEVYIVENPQPEISIENHNLQLRQAFSAFWRS